MMAMAMNQFPKGENKVKIDFEDSKKCPPQKKKNRENVMVLFCSVSREKLQKSKTNKNSRKRSGLVLFG